jgi:hypothetical protein
VELERTEAKHDDGSQSIAWRGQGNDIIIVESRPEAFSVNWTSWTDDQEFIGYCRALDYAAEGTSTIYSCSARTYRHVSSKDLLYGSWNSDDLGFIRLNLPLSIAIAWRPDHVNDSSIVGCAMSEFNPSFISHLFEGTASEALTPVTKELGDLLGFLRDRFKER